MAHADKSWTVPLESERGAVWRKAGLHAAVVVARGRFVGVWSQSRKRRHLEINVTPQSGWRTRRHLPSVRREARAVAAHLGLEDSSVRLEDHGARRK